MGEAEGNPRLHPARWRHDGRAVAGHLGGRRLAARELVARDILVWLADCRITLEGCSGTAGFEHTDWWIGGWLRLVNAWHTAAPGPDLLHGA